MPLKILSPLTVIGAIAAEFVDAVKGVGYLILIRRRIRRRIVPGGVRFRDGRDRIVPRNQPGEKNGRILAHGGGGLIPAALGFDSRGGGYSESTQS